MNAVVEQTYSRVSRGHTSQLEEARQLRDHLARAIALSAITGAVTLTTDDAAALERLLSDSIRIADEMGAR